MSLVVTQLQYLLDVAMQFGEGLVRKKCGTQCGKIFLVHAGTKNKPMLACSDKECGYKRVVEPTEEIPELRPSVPPATASIAAGT